jgi:APA family basic amino acid/polyamine antiporter
VFVAGKLASCAAMAFAVGSYVWPEHARILAVATVVAVVTINLLGVEKSATAAIVIVMAVVAVGSMQTPRHPCRAPLHFVGSRRR